MDIQEILQDLAKIRISETEKNEEALVDFMLQYLDFVSNKSANANKDNLYHSNFEKLDIFSRFDKNSNEKNCNEYILYCSLYCLTSSFESSASFA